MTSGATGSSSNSGKTNIFTEIPFGQASYAASLGANHIEYDKVLKLLKPYLPNCNPSSIFKIHNLYLETVLKTGRFIYKVNFKCKIQERISFHGTNLANVEAILEENIDWRLHGSNNGQIHGKGAYFSNKYEYSSPNTLLQYL
jgi:hypothetical protein